MEVQWQMVRSIPGLDQAELLRPGYAIEYDSVDATELDRSLRVKCMEGLYLAGQINGTSGYEEAACQGIMAGINAALSVKGEPPFTLDRTEGYTGILIDDLISKGTNEPYRMFTSRAEFRLHLRIALLYFVSSCSLPHDRLDYERIAELIPPGASVLDLGCGSGSFLAGLRQTNHRRLVGVELDEQKILAGIGRGLDVIQADLNKGLGAFADGQFDCVVLSQTLQAVQDVERVLTEMVRIGRTCIVSIPNFGYHRLRKMLAETGRAPKSAGVLHYEWYNTPNIRFFTIADFEDFCRQKNIQVHRRIALDTEARAEVFEHPNLNANLAVFVISAS